MKYCLSLLIGFISTVPVFAQNLPSADSIQILSIINDWNDAWQTKDYILATNGYSNDARFTNAFGDKRNGRTEVINLLKTVFALPFVMAGNSETTEHRFQILDGTNVIVHTAVIRRGQKMPDNTVLADRQTTHMRVFQKNGNHWEIKAHLISDAREKQLPKN